MLEDVWWIMSSCADNKNDDKSQCPYMVVRLAVERAAAAAAANLGSSVVCYKSVFIYKNCLLLAVFMYKGLVS